jgi:hypothetical protein
MGESSEVQSDVVCTVVWLTAVVVCEVVVVTSLELLLVSEHPHIDISIAEMTAVTIIFFIVSPLYL